MSLWFVIAYLGVDDRVESTEMHGQFESETVRSEAIDEIVLDNPTVRTVIIPIDCEGDDEATLEVAE